MLLVNGYADNDNYTVIDTVTGDIDLANTNELQQLSAMGVKVAGLFPHGRVKAYSSVERYMLDLEQQANKAINSYISLVLSETDKIVLADVVNHYASVKSNIPYGVDIIGVRAFDGCINMKTADIPSSVFDIQDRAFNNCTALEEVSLSSGIKHIGKKVFSSCSSLKSIVIPDSVLEIGEDILCKCRNLEYVRLPERLCKRVSRVVDNDMKSVIVVC